MTQLGVAVIGGLADPVAASFQAGPEDFWTACAKQDPGTRNEVTTVTGLRDQVRAALEYLDQNAQAAPLLPDLLLARPGDADLRSAIGAALPDALIVVPQPRFELERMIAQALDSGQAKALHDSLARIDALSAAVTAYKAMHDALHLLQPHLVLMRGVAADKGRWREFKVYRDIFRQQLMLIDGAGKKLTDNGFASSLDFRDAIGAALDMLATAVTGGETYNVEDAMSELASRIEEGLSSVDVLMRNTAQEANAPFQRALAFFEPMVATTVGSTMAPLITSYVSFARQISADLAGAVAEHGRWQRLDQKFDQLQRAVDDAKSGGAQIASLWRMTRNGLNELCAGSPPPQWAAQINALIGLAGAGLQDPISPPVADPIRDQVKDLIDSGRARFMAVDQSLLDWLEQSVSKRPALVSLLRGEGAGNG